MATTSQFHNSAARYTGNPYYFAIGVMVRGRSYFSSEA